MQEIVKRCVWCRRSIFGRLYSLKYMISEREYGIFFNNDIVGGAITFSYESVSKYQSLVVYA